MYSALGLKLRLWPGRVEVRFRSGIWKLRMHDFELAQRNLHYFNNCSAPQIGRNVMYAVQHRRHVVTPVCVTLQIFFLVN